MNSILPPSENDVMPNTFSDRAFNERNVITFSLQAIQPADEPALQHVAYMLRSRLTKYDYDTSAAQTE